MPAVAIAACSPRDIIVSQRHGDYEGRYAVMVDGGLIFLADGPAAEEIYAAI
jgi:hypothetical protein